MSKLTLFGLLPLISFHSLLAEENITYEYHYTEENTIIEVQESTTTDGTTKLSKENNVSLKTLDTNETTVKISPFEEALQKAKDEKKIIMLAIRAIDCNYCDRMETETLVDEDVKEALEEDFITLHYNQDLEELPLGFPEGMTPNFIFVDKDENILQMYPGMRNPEQFIEALNEILAL
jgi:thioredoxin-related protein